MRERGVLSSPGRRSATTISVFGPGASRPLTNPTRLGSACPQLFLDELTSGTTEVPGTRCGVGESERDLRSAQHEHGAAGQRVAALEQEDLLDRVVDGLQGMARLGHPVPLVEHVLGPEPVRVARRALLMVVGLEAEGIGLAVSVEEA